MGIRSRTGGFLRRRLADAALVITWLVVLFNAVQLGRTEDAGAARLVFSYGSLLLIGAVMTWLWWRTRKRTST